MTYICQFRGCEFFESCPMGRRLEATSETYSDEDTGERLYDAICDEVDHIETGIPESALVCDFKPIKLEWKGPMVERYKKLEKRLTPQPDPWTADNDIDYVAYCALDYYRVLTEWAEYLRGETDEKPAPIKHPKVGESNAGDWMVGTIKPTILDPMKHLIENLPSLNTADGKYPFKRIDEMFEALNQLAFILNHCEEELRSDVGSSMGLAAKRNYELHMLVCPEKTPFGKIILETKLIAEAFENFYKAFCGAAWALKDKVAKRESGKIDLTKLDKDIIVQQDKDHPEYELLQIEIDTLYCLPEASPWLFLRICRVMAKALERAKEDRDVNLPNYRWFAEGLSLVVRGLGHASGDENEITSDRVDAREALRNLVSALIRWQTMCVTNGMASPDLIERIVNTLTLPYGELDEETPGAYDQFIEDMFFEERDGGLYYKPGPLKGILETCEHELVDWKLLPEDITSHVCENSIYFIEENDMGWYDEDRDEFMSKAITRIYNGRHPKANDPTAEHERRLAEYLKESIKEVTADFMDEIKKAANRNNETAGQSNAVKKPSKSLPCLQRLQKVVAVYFDPDKNKVTGGLLHCDGFKEIVGELEAKAWSNDYNVSREEAYEATMLWMDARLKLIDYIASLKRNDCLDKIKKALENDDNHNFLKGFGTKDTETRPNEHLIKEFGFITRTVKTPFNEIPLAKKTRMPSTNEPTKNRVVRTNMVEMALRYIKREEKKGRKQVPAKEAAEYVYNKVEENPDEYIGGYPIPETEVDVENDPLVHQINRIRRLRNKHKVKSKDKAKAARQT